MEVKEYDRCLRCGRKLKDPRTRRLGYGKVCFDKHKKISVPVWEIVEKKENEVIPF